MDLMPIFCENDKEYINMALIHDDSFDHALNPRLATAKQQRKNHNWQHILGTSCNPYVRKLYKKCHSYLFCVWSYRF